MRIRIPLARGSRIERPAAKPAVVRAGALVPTGATIGYHYSIDVPSAVAAAIGAVAERPRVLAPALIVAADRATQSAARIERCRRDRAVQLQVMRVSF